MLRGGENDGLGSMLAGQKRCKEKQSADENGRRSEMQIGEETEKRR